MLLFIIHIIHWILYMTGSCTVDSRKKKQRQRDHFRKRYDPNEVNSSESSDTSDSSESNEDWKKMPRYCASHTKVSCWWILMKWRFGEPTRYLWSGPQWKRGIRTQSRNQHFDNQPYIYIYVFNIHRWFPVFCFFWFDDWLYRGLENDSSKISAALHVGMVCVPRWLKQRQIPRTKEGAVGKQPQPQSMLMFLLWK